MSISRAQLGAPHRRKWQTDGICSKNLRETLQRLLEGKQSWLQAAAQVGPERKSQIEAMPPSPVMRLEVERQARRALRQERFQAVRELHRNGVSQREIARRYGMSVHTVAKYIERATCPVYPEGRSSRSILNPYLGYLEGEWAAGRRNASQLWRGSATRDLRVAVVWSVSGQRTSARGSPERWRTHRVYTRRHHYLPAGQYGYS